MTTYTRVDIPPPPGQAAKLPYKFHITGVEDRQKFHDDLHHGPALTNKPGELPPLPELLALIEELSTEKPYYVLKVSSQRARALWSWLDGKRLWSRNHPGIEELYMMLIDID